MIALNVNRFSPDHPPRLLSVHFQSSDGIIASFLTVRAGCRLLTSRLPPVLLSVPLWQMEDDGIDSLTVYGPVCCVCMYVCTMYVCMWALILFPSPQFYAVLSFLPVPFFFCLLRSPINFSQRSSSSSLTNYPLRQPLFFALFSCCFSFFLSLFG